MTKKKRVIVIPIIILAVMGFLFLYKRLPTKEKSPHLLLSGNIEVTLVKVSFKIAGRIFKRMVDEGDEVKQGDFIAKLEDLELVDLKRKAEASLETAQQKMQSLLLTIEREEKTSVDEIHQSEATLSAA
ncbi:MAG: hypothetical protein A2156_04340 [Deltaproteobacteria bacterium RBG_16_48_10]|nr:MAG: hypothetical protein A2156_04340 [Deltaproteobacteria bacterium RBG_16_48_10]